MNNNQKATKRALLTSVMALVMCVVMLVGTTFAWFTDTASTAVNKIQAGNLDIELQMKNNDGKWVDAENQTLNFLQKLTARNRFRRRGTSSGSRVVHTSCRSCALSTRAIWL